MKIFALNLCLEFATREIDPIYSFEPISFDELMGHLFKGSEFPDQQYYVLAENSEAFRQYVFDLQTNEVWRQMSLNICFLFPGTAQRDRFLEGYREHFREIDAAGGLVSNENGEYLFIYNRAQWTLPKGGVEWREAIDEAAVREVREETGLAEVQLGSKMGETYHTFSRRGQWVLKTTHWYYMQASSSATLVPQADENIEDVRWISREEWLKIAETSFPLVRSILETEFARKLNESNDYET